MDYPILKQMKHYLLGEKKKLFPSNRQAAYKIVQRGFIHATGTSL